VPRGNNFFTRKRATYPCRLAGSVAAAAAVPKSLFLRCSRPLLLFKPLRCRLRILLLLANVVWLLPPWEGLLRQGRIVTLPPGFVPIGGQTLPALSRQARHPRSAKGWQPWRTGPSEARRPVAARRSARLKSHEDWTAEIVLNPHSKISEILERHRNGLVTDIAAV